MRQLEMIAGERGFRDGLRDYLKRYAFGNATWLDLVNILEARNPGQVADWSHAWVEERGRPEITTTLTPGTGGTISKLSLRQRDPLGRGTDMAPAAEGSPWGSRAGSISMRSR